MPKVDAAIAGQILTLLGYDGEDLQNVKVDTNGQLIILAGSVGGTPAALKVDSEGYVHVKGVLRGTTHSPMLADSDNYVYTHPRNVVSHYNAQVMSRVRDLNADAGTNVLDSTKLAAGEFVTVTRVLAYNVNTDCSRIEIGVYNGSTLFVSAVEDTPGLRGAVICDSWIFLEENDRIRVNFYGCTEGDAINVFIFGFQRET